MKINWILMVLCLSILGCSEKMPEVSFDEYQVMAEQGDPDAQAQVGYCYQYGIDVAKDPRQALKWNLKAAKQGSAMGQHHLAVMYDEGVGVPENNSKALKWYTRASEQGYSEAQLNLGMMYWRGKGVKKDVKVAWDLFNHVRTTSDDKEAKERARSALDQIKEELGIRASGMSRYSYPNWDNLPLSSN